MGLGLLGSILFSGGKNRIKETVEVFRPNAEASATRGHEMDTAVLQQLAAEFARPERGLFDAFVDGLNRLPRPVIVLSLLFLIGLPVFDPIWATQIFTALALVPDAIWALNALVFSFYFGGRMQAKNIDFKRSLAGSAAALPAVMDNIKAIGDLREVVEEAPPTVTVTPEPVASVQEDVETTPGVARTRTDAATEVAVLTRDADNRAVNDWIDSLQS